MSKIGLFCKSEPHTAIDTDALSDTEVSKVLTGLNAAIRFYRPLWECETPSRRLQNLMVRHRQTSLSDFLNDGSQRFANQEGVGKIAYEELRTIAKRQDVTLPSYDEVKR